MKVHQLHAAPSVSRVDGTTILTPLRKSKLRDAFAVMVTAIAQAGAPIPRQAIPVLIDSWNIVKGKDDPELPFQADPVADVGSKAEEKVSQLIVPA